MKRKNNWRRMVAMFLWVSILTGCAASDESFGKSTTAQNQTTTEGSTTTTTESVGIGGDEFECAAPYNLYFYLSQSVIDLVSENEYIQWCNTFEDAGMGGTRNPKDCNVYTFLKEFSIPRASIEEICAKYKEAIPDSEYFTTEQVEMLYNGTELEVYQYFANPHAVLVGKYAYSPKWMVKHTAENYLAEGITYEILSAEMDDLLVPCNEEERDYLRTQLAALKELEK